MDWFRHDINMESDDAVANLMLDYRTEGLGVYIHTLHLLFLNEGRFDKTKLIRNLKKLSPKGEEIFEAMLEEGLVKLDGELVYSERADLEIKYDKDRRERYSSMGKASAEQRANKGKTKAERKLNVGSTQAQHLNPNLNPNQLNNNDDSSLEGLSKLEESNFSNDSSDDSYSDSSNINTNSAAYNGVKAHDAIKYFIEKFNSIDGLVKYRKPSINDELAIDRILREFSQEEIEETFDKLAKSDFLRGANDIGWKATFDWIIKLDNFKKVFNGNYDNAKGRKGSKGRNVPTDLSGQYAGFKADEVEF